jgi:hypothetical protein
MLNKTGRLLGLALSDDEIAVLAQPYRARAAASVNAWTQRAKNETSNQRWS